MLFSFFFLFQVSSLLSARLFQTSLPALHRLSLIKSPSGGGVSSSVNNTILSPRAHRLTLLASINLVNPVGVALVLAVIGVLAPGRRADSARLIVRATASAFLASLMSATIAGTVLN